MSFSGFLLETGERREPGNICERICQWGWGCGFMWSYKITFLYDTCRVLKHVMWNVLPCGLPIWRVYSHKRDASCLTQWRSWWSWEQVRVGMQYYFYVHREPRIEDTGNSITTPFLESVPGGDPTQMTSYTKRITLQTIWPSCPVIIRAKVKKCEQAPMTGAFSWKLFSKLKLVTDTFCWEATERHHIHQHMLLVAKLLAITCCIPVCNLSFN